MDDQKKAWQTRTLSILIIGILVIVIAVWVSANKKSQTKQNQISLQQGTAFPKGIAIKAFKLIGDNNRPFTNKNLQGQWSLLFFGFTRCPMVCPTTLSELNKAYGILQKLDAKQLPQVVFISVDPERDTPTAIKKYVVSFNSHFIGATGNKTNLDKLTKNLGVLYAKAKKSGEENYEVNHSGMILVVNPQGEWAGILTPPFNAELIATDLMTLQKRE